MTITSLPNFYRSFVSLLLFVGLCVFTSCRSYKMLEGKSRPAYFTADSTLFSDPDSPKPAIYYSDLLNLRGYYPNVIELHKGETNTAIISKPSFFHGYDNFLVYPGEHILIKDLGWNDYVFTTANGNKRRNRELLFFKTFQNIHQYPLISRIDSFTIEKFTEAEKKLKKEIEKSISVSHYRFDSLMKTTRASRKFKKIAGYYLTNKYENSLLLLFREYKDSLKANGILKDKLNEMLPLFTKLKKKEELEQQIVVLNEFTDIFLPFKISKIKTEAEFIDCFTAINNSFVGITRDYMLSRLMYYANVQRINISSAYIEKYKTDCQDKVYKNLVAQLFGQQAKNDEAVNANSTNSLLSVSRKSTITLENIIKEYKSKIVVLDFWASWCVPCREDIPYLKTIKKEFKNRDIVFINISVDKEIQPWQKAVIATNLEKKNNYLMIKPNESLFIQHLEINTIPRYILIGKDGKIISKDLPRPSNAGFKETLNKYLSL